MKAFYSHETEDQRGKEVPILSVQPNLLEDVAQVMMYHVSWLGKVLTGSCAKPLTAPVLLEGFRHQSLKRNPKPVPLFETLNISLPILLTAFSGQVHILWCSQLLRFNMKYLWAHV